MCKICVSWVYLSKMLSSFVKKYVFVAIMRLLSVIWGNVFFFLFSIFLKLFNNLTIFLATNIFLSGK